MSKEQGEKHLLSEGRGGRTGIGIMRLMLKLLGVNRTCEFCWVIALFYALFDRTARRSASYYIRHRFPHDGPIRRFYHIWALFTSQGQALIETASLFSGHTKDDCAGYDNLTSLLDQPGGFILLCSHFGQWQGMIHGMELKRKPVHLLARTDKNTNVEKFRDIGSIRQVVEVIPTESAMGGLLDVYNALIAGHIVCMMGDRCWENDSVTVPFLGGTARFPAAAFLMSARTGAPVVPIFAYRTHRHDRITTHFFEAIYPDSSIARPKRNDLKPQVARYISALEEMAQEHPYECFIFEDIWSDDEHK